MVVATLPEMPAAVAIEVRRPFEFWIGALERMHVHLKAGVPAVVVIDPVTESASVFRPDARPEVFEKDGTLTIPDVLPGFEVPVARLFEE